MQTYVTDKFLAARYGVCRATIWQWSKTGNLPRPLRLGPSCTRWSLAEIERHEADRAAARDQTPA